LHRIERSCRRIFSDPRQRPRRSGGAFAHLPDSRERRRNLNASHPENSQHVKHHAGTVDGVRSQSQSACRTSLPLCDEAIRLTSSLAEHPAGDTPRTHALLALLLLQAARFSVRINSDGEILLVQHQDRSMWARVMISRAMVQLDRASSGESISQFHLQAGIAACHCVAQNYDATDWKEILELSTCSCRSRIRL